MTEKKIYKNVTILVSGGTKKQVELTKVSDGIQMLGLSGNYTASLNGNPIGLDEDACDYAFITYAASVKGNARTAKPKKILDNATSTIIWDVEGENLYVNGVRITKPQMKKLVNAGLDCLGYKGIK